MFGLELGYVSSLRSLSTVNNFELYLSAFLKRLEAFHVQSGVVNEYIVALLVADKSVTFLVVEPLYSTSVHMIPPKKYKK